MFRTYDDAALHLMESGYDFSGSGKFTCGDDNKVIIKSASGYWQVKNA